MAIPSATAASSLYRTQRSYRRQSPATAELVRDTRSNCFNECMADCAADGGWPQECRTMCRNNCGLGPPIAELCESGTHLCFHTGARAHCCPDGYECCDMRWTNRYPWGPALQCCPPGRRCCSFGSRQGLGCYDPVTQQCRPGGIFDCPAGRELCDDQCCAVGEVCTPEGCARPENTCNGHRCRPGEQCTPQGCCRPDRVTAEGCCPDDRVKCGEDCCGAGSSCSSTLGCCPPGTCCETAPCPAGSWCCEGKKCCPNSRPVCRPDAGDALGYKCFRA